METQVIILVAYLIGSISSAIVVCKMFGLGDPRTQGSNNPGATNVLRLGGKLPALLTLAGDLLKGVIPVLIAHQYGDPDFIGFVAFAAFLGHLYPIYFGFKGGKGVATLLGALFALHYSLGFWFIGVWFMVAMTTRYSSLAAMVASAVLPIVVWQSQIKPLILPLTVMAVLVLIRHKANMVRLIKRQETKIGQSARAKG